MTVFFDDVKGKNIDVNKHYSIAEVDTLHVKYYGSRLRSLYMIDELMYFANLISLQ